MATIADVLRHLVKHAPELYEDGRAEFLDAIDAAFPEPAAAETAAEPAAAETGPEPAAAEPSPDPLPKE
jgi:hypothetical protein